MASASLSSIPKWQVLDSNGVPIAGAKLAAYKVGTDIPKDLYTDYQASSTAAWPLVFDSDGRAEVWLGAGLYKLVLTDADDVIIWTVDGVGSGGGAGGGSSGIVNTVIGATDSLVSLDPGAATLISVLGYRAIGDEGGGTFYWDDNITNDDGGVYIKPTSLAITDPGRWVRIMNEGQPVNVRWYGSWGTGTQVDTSFFAKAITYAAANGKSLYLPKGTYFQNADPGFVYTVPLVMEPEAMLQWYVVTGCVIAPIIGLNDFTRHFDTDFNGTTSGYEPIFPAGTIVYADWFCTSVQTLGTGDDDTVPLQAAINSIKTNGGTLKLRPGTFVISDPLIIGSNVKIEGEREATIIQCGNADHPFQNSNPFSEFFIPAFWHDTDASTLNNVEICNLTINGNFPGDGSWSAPVALNASNSKIHDLHIYDTAYALTLGGVHGDSTNVKVYDNYLISCGAYSSSGGILIVNGEQVTIRNNLIRQPNYGGSYSGQYTICIDPSTALQGVKDCIISDNSCNAPIFTGPWANNTNTVRNVTIKDNQIDIADGYLNIGESAINVGSSMGGPYGDIVIDRNIIKMHEPGYGISLSASGHVADSYEVTNNDFIVENTDSGTNMIRVDGVYSARTIIEGNIAKSDVTTNARFVYENACDGIQYGINPSRNFNNPFYGGSDSSTWIMGTIMSDMTANGNLKVNGSIVNTAYTSLFNSMIVGLDTTNGGINSSKMVVNPGTCTSTNGGFMMSLLTSITKDTTSTWAAGNDVGGMAAGVTATDETGYHFFILGKSSSPTAIDAGFDTDPNATNLLATAAVISAGYNTYRRIGWGYRVSYAYQINSFWQRGDYFNYDGFAISDQTALTGATRTNIKLRAAPLGISTQLRLALDAWTSNQADPSNVFYFYDGIGAYPPAYVGVAANHITRWWEPPAVGANLWSDTTARIGVTSVSTGESPAPLTPVTCRATMLGWMDPRGKY